MTVADWLARATDDAQRRGMPELVPLLQTLARATDALRAADAEFAHPAAENAAAEYAAHAEDRAADDAEHAEKRATEHTDKGGDGDGRR